MLNGITGPIMSPARPTPPSGQPLRAGLKDGAKPGKGDGAFDTWLKQGLHKLYDDVAGEPVPELLLKMIEEDRKK